MARDDERLVRSQQEPIVGGLPELPGILTALNLTPGLGLHLRGLADELLVKDHPGRHDQPRRARDAGDGRLGGQRLLLLHGLARRVRERAPAAQRRGRPACRVVDDIKRGSSEGLDDKMRALLHIARTVQRQPLDLTAGDIADAHAAGATDGDVQLAVLIAAGFSMYNRLVEGFRAHTPPTRRGLPGAGRRDRRARLQLAPGHLRPGLIAVRVSAR